MINYFWVLDYVIYYLSFLFERNEKEMASHSFLQYYKYNTQDYLFFPLNYVLLKIN